MCATFAIPQSASPMEHYDIELLYIYSLLTNSSLYYNINNNNNKKNNNKFYFMVMI